MEIQGDMAHLSADEQRVSGYPSPMVVWAMDARVIEGRLKMQDDALFGLLSADDDEVTIAQRGSSRERHAALQADREIAITMMAKIGQYMLETELRQL